MARNTITADNVLDYAYTPAHMSGDNLSEFDSAASTIVGNITYSQDNTLHKNIDVDTIEYSSDAGEYVFQITFKKDGQEVASISINFDDTTNNYFYFNSVSTTDTAFYTNLTKYTVQSSIPIEKITQLKPFLQSIANAIRTKKGTTETINAQNFVSEIESIEGGNWTEEQGHDGSINFTIRYTDVYVMDFSGTPWLHHSKMDANQTINYTNAKMILIYVDIPNNITTTNLNNIEILSTNNHSYIILKPTGENFSCDIEVEGP